MPKLVPDDLILVSKVLDAGTNDGPKKIIRTELQNELIKHNLTTSSALETISTVMHFSRKEINKISAAKIALELNGVLKNQEVVDTQPIVQFVFQDSNVNLNGIFNPKR